VVDRIDLLYQCFANHTIFTGHYQASTILGILGYPDFPGSARAASSTTDALGLGAHKYLRKWFGPVTDAQAISRLLFLLVKRPDLEDTIMRALGDVQKSAMYITTFESLRSCAPRIDGRSLSFQHSSPIFIRYYEPGDDLSVRCMKKFFTGDPSGAAADARRFILGRINSTTRRSKWADGSLVQAARVAGHLELPAEKRKSSWRMLLAIPTNATDADYRAGFVMINNSPESDVHKAYIPYLARRPTPDDIAACEDPIKVCRRLPQEWIDVLKDSEQVKASLLKKGLGEIDFELMRTAFDPHKTRYTVMPKLDPPALTQAWIQEQEERYRLVVGYEVVWDALMKANFAPIVKVLIGQCLKLPEDPTLRSHLELFPDARNFVENALDHIESDSAD
jgi:hypothetical protein